MKTLAVYCVLLFSLQSVNAIELTHRKFTLNAMRNQAWTSGSLPFGFVSEFEIRREVNLFSSNSGFAILNTQPKVTSEYDETSNAYSMTHFYTAAKQRKHLISNFVMSNSLLVLRYFLWLSNSPQKRLQSSNSPFLQQYTLVACFLLLCASCPC